MTTTEVHELLEEHKNDRGIVNWEKLAAGRTDLKSYGIGLTVLRKLAKKIGRNRGLSLALWNDDYYDAKIIALLIDDPKQITREQAEQQVDNMKGGYLAHVFSSCDASLAKTDFVPELCVEWIHAPDSMRKRCGYGLLYELSKSKKKSAPDDAFFLELIEEMRSSFPNVKTVVQGSIAGALIGVGKRNKVLNAAALKLANELGPVAFSDKTDCEPINVVKHLTSDYIKERLGV